MSRISSLGSNADYETIAYSGEDEWVRCDEVSPKITRAFQAFKNPPSVVKKLSAKILQFPGRKK